MAEKVAEVVRPSQGGAGGGGERGGVVVEVGKWFSSWTRDTVGSSGLGDEFRTLVVASISGSINAEEK